MKNIGQNALSFFQLELKLEIRAFKDKKGLFLHSFKKYVQNDWMRNMHYADVKATAIQFAMEFYHIFLSHTVVLAFILGKNAI